MPEDDTLKEHMKYSPNCRFIQLGKVQEPTIPELICKICYKNDPNVCYAVCGHISCGLCALSVTNCPFCKLAVEDLIKIYF